MIAKQIHYIAQLAGIEAIDVRHILFGEKRLDPVLDVEVTEAHLFPPDAPMARDAAIQEFERLAQPHGISRKWDCMPEPGMAPNICYVVPIIRKAQMEEITAALNLPMQWGVLITPKTLLSYTAPQNACVIITGIYLATIPTPNDPLLTVGDWRSPYFDATGKATAWLEVNSEKATNETITYFNLFNRPIFFLLNGGESFKVQILRVLGDVPDTFNVMIVANAFLAPARSYDKLSRQSTQFIKG